MQNLPSIELLEAKHRFPGTYIFKAIGHAGDGFMSRAVVAVRDALGSEQDPPFQVRQTRSGRHVAISFEPVVDDAEQVLDVYRKLLDLQGLVLLL